MKSVFINCLFFFFVGFSLLANAQSYPELIKLTKSATKQNYEESEEKISKTVKKHKNDPYVYLERYFFYYKFYKNELALQDINKAIELMPSKYLFYEYRIDVLFEMDKLEDAWKDISTIYAMDKTIPDSYVYRGQYFFKCDSLQASFQNFNQAISIYENNNAQCWVMSRCYRGRGNLNLAFGNTDKAIADFTKAITKARDAKKDNLLILRAKAQFLKNNISSAQADIEAALDYKPDTLTLGYIYALKGNAGEVEVLVPNILSKKASCDRCKASMIYDVACYFAILNNKEKALQYLKNQYKWVLINSIGFS